MVVDVVETAIPIAAVTISFKVIAIALDIDRGFDITPYIGTSRSDDAPFADDDYDAQNDTRTVLLTTQPDTQ